MRLVDITATADPAGNRIDLAWDYPDGDDLPGVRVVRREGTHPEGPDDGDEVVVVDEDSGVRSAQDDGLKGETVYYYTLFPFRGAPPQFEPDRHNRVAAMATSPYDLAGLMYRLLPEIYRRYDAVRTPRLDSGDAADLRDSGMLRRFLDLPGGQLDQLYSLIRASLDLCDLDRVDGDLLPLLADWIGWPTTFALPVAAQRNEIRHAPRLYRTIGIIPTLEATVARVTGWSSRTKEFVHNVARTNQPERLTLWSISRDSNGNWGAPVQVSHNYTYEGRTVCAPLADGSRLFVYHTSRRHGWDIWAKRLADGDWQPSDPVVDRPGIDKHPTVARQEGRLWLFWETYDPEQPAPDRRWRIAVRTRTDGDWSPVEFFGDPATERRLPTAAVDRTGGLWLFWLERSGTAWEVRYNRHDGTAWQPGSGATLPTDATGTPGPDGDLVVVAHPSDTVAPLWLFWAHRAPTGPARPARWAVACRSKQSLAPDAVDWSPGRALPKTGDVDDREPAPLPTADGGIDLFWSSTRGGSWSVFRSLLDTGALTFGPVQQVTTSPYSERAPLAQDIGSGTTLLTYRSNESLAHTSTVYGATRTLDMRYAGTTTVNSRDAGKLALRGMFTDFQTYTHDAGHGGVRTNDDRISRDTVGLYLTPTTSDAGQIEAGISRLRGVLADFMPISGRAVFVTESPRHDVDEEARA
jgi:phage tail-like protein